jgi:hypothetical protein
MADVRGASGVPGVNAFGGTSTPTPSTPLYIDLETGNAYVLISNAVKRITGDPAYAQGTFTVRTGTAKILSRHLILTGTQRATLSGTATLRIG